MRPEPGELTLPEARGDRGFIKGDITKSVCVRCCPEAQQDKSRKGAIGYGSE